MKKHIQTCKFIPLQSLFIVTIIILTSHYGSHHHHHVQAIQATSTTINTIVNVSSMKPIRSKTRDSLNMVSSLAFVRSSVKNNKDDGTIFDVMLKIQGGATTTTTTAATATTDDDSDDASTLEDEYDETDDNDEYDDTDTDNDEEEADAEAVHDDTDTEVSESESSEEEEEEDTNDDISKTKREHLQKNAIGNTQYDEAFALSPMQDMGITLGVMVMCNKLDLTNTKIIRFARYVHLMVAYRVYVQTHICIYNSMDRNLTHLTLFNRFAFIAYIVAMQLFLLYVRYNAKLINDTTLITINNPLSSLLQSQNGNDDNQTGGDMVKNIANSLLSAQSTIRDYDLQQAKNMNNGLLFPMLMLWFLHFKLGQVQPLFFQTVSGIKEMVLSPLFQIYVFGKHLERPFKKPNPMESLQESQEDEQQKVDVQEEEDQESEQMKDNKDENVTTEQESDDEESDEESSSEDGSDAENDNDGEDDNQEEGDEEDHSDSEDMKDGTDSEDDDH
jgi:hypothetical protein